MLKFAVGHSNDPDSAAAIAEVLEQIQESLGQESPNAGILFAAIDFDHRLILSHIVETFPQIQLIGGTTDGEISSRLGFDQDSLTMMVFCSDGVQIGAGIGLHLSQDPDMAVQAALEQAKRTCPDAIEFCLTLPESLTIGGVTILESLKQQLGNDVPIFGGLTADQWRSNQTYQFYQSQIHSDAVPILLFSGPILFSHGIASGWKPIGKAGRVTKAQGNIVYEIDERPALAFYQRYLGVVPPSSEYPLALYDGESDRNFMRAPSGIYDPAQGSITFFGDVPTHSIVQITETTRDDIIRASQFSTLQALENYPGQTPAAALFFSCASRRQILGSRTKEEYAQVQKCLSPTLPSLPSCGFYTNGEIAPLTQKGAPYFHNETFITLLLGEG
jgi:hypothetical protein